MNSSILKLKLGWLALLLGASTAFALPIDLNPTNSVPGDAGSATVLSWLNDLITTYNGENTPALPSPATLSFDSNEDAPMAGYPDNTGTAIAMPMGTYEYLVLKWGGGFTPGAFSAYYIGGMTGTWTFNSPNDRDLSGYRLYDADTPPSVPDGGTGVMLLGAALGLLGLIRRWI
ncbi:MAG: hypothetical protein RLZZ447_1416 [Verrucomicrobiota bacterium]